MSKDKPADIPTRQSTGANCAPAFVYTIFIKATVEQVWNGLIDRELTKAYWGHYNQSDWQAGSRWDQATAIREQLLFEVSAE